MKWRFVKEWFLHKATGRRSRREPPLICESFETPLIGFLVNGAGDMDEKENTKKTRA